MFLGVKRLVAAPSAAASTGYHTDAQHPKELKEQTIIKKCKCKLQIWIFLYTVKSLLEYG